MIQTLVGGHPVNGFQLQEVLDAVLGLRRYFLELRL
jgi:hypothetical protein